LGPRSSLLAAFLLRRQDLGPATPFGLWPRSSLLARHKGLVPSFWIGAELPFAERSKESCRREIFLAKTFLTRISPLRLGNPLTQSARFCIGVTQSLYSRPHFLHGHGTWTPRLCSSCVNATQNPRPRPRFPRVRT